MLRVYVSYRDGDATYMTRRLCDRLRVSFDVENVWRGRPIPLGTDYRTLLRETMARCRAAVVVIGPGWVRAAEPGGAPRLTNPADPVRLEVEAALAAGIPVVPVLLEDVAPPRPPDLPLSLRPLCYRHGLVIRYDLTFEADAARLVNGVRELLASAPPDPAGPPPAPTWLSPPPPPTPAPGRRAPVWPTQADYKDALQNPDSAFADPDLRASQAEPSVMGVPRARSGAFASVYKMTRGPLAAALKLFNFPSEDRAARYRAVADHVASLGVRGPDSLVRFAYLPEAVRVGRGWYPAVVMEWVKGKPLAEWVREAVGKSPPDTAAVAGLAGEWARLVKDLQAARVAHGDLQHDNVVVRPNGDLALIDYDTMCVPQLVGLEQLEFGKPAYQHPGRVGQRLSLDLDHFSAWAIRIALRAIAADPTLYDRFVARTDNENLLFAPPDMAEPASSELWRELLGCGDDRVRAWAGALRESLDGPFEGIPPFTENSPPG